MWDDGELGVVVLLTVIVTTGVCLAGAYLHIDASHQALGSIGRACFANNTCRPGLRCLRAEGIDPTCVKE